MAGSLRHDADRRNAWSTAPSRGTVSPYGDPSLPSPSRAGTRFFAAVGRLFRTLLVLGILGAAGYYGWQYGRPLWNKMRLNSDVESAAVFFARQAPRAAGNEAELKALVTAAADDKLRGHLALKARWYLAMGPDAASLRVLRDDQFAEADKAFAARTVDAAAKKRRDPPGTDHETLDYPRGAYTHAAACGDETWIVIACWIEDAN